MKFIFFYLFQIIASSLFAQCKEDLIYVHLIPHSHDDYGWYKTIDQYFLEENPINYSEGVKQILDSVYKEIQKDESRRFIQVEIGFLNMWWQLKNEDERQTYKKLVQNGQIEIINGGWTMHDEASIYFEDLIDQMTVGHMWVQENLGVTPTIGWQIDTFGHQQSNAALYSQMGFNAQWFARIDYQDYNIRKQNQALEMIWSPNQQSGEENYIFSAVNYKHYSAPEGFYFEKDDLIDENNVKDKSDIFVNYFRNMAQNFKSNHLLHTMGEDFAYSRAEKWYGSIDNLINYVNSNSDIYGMKILYSTPSQYLEEINKQRLTWPENRFDFYPYADKPNSYWTGYFTSRPSIKVFAKDSGRYLQAVRNIFAVENMNKRTNILTSDFKKYLQTLEFFEQQVATLSHHDAISGTESQEVADDYVKRLNTGYEQIRSFLHPLLEEYTKQDIQEQDISYTQCNWNATISNCQINSDQLSQGKPILIMIYNPSVSRNLNIRIKVPSSNISVVNKINMIVQSDLICSNQDLNDCDLYFSDYFKGYQYQYYKIKPSQNSKPVQAKQQPSTSDKINIQLTKTSSLKVELKQAKFSYEVWTQKKDIQMRKQLKKYSFQIQYNYYNSQNDHNEQVSGAYIFRPIDQSSQIYSEIQKINVFQGKTLTVIALIGTKITTQMRIYSDSSMKRVFELETLVHSIDVSDNIGKEVVMLVNTDLKNNQIFYTDSNGLEMQERKINYRPNWNLEVNENISGNYYPIGAMISIQDINTKKKITVVNDRSQGGTSLKEGQIELMLHRRILEDDKRGLGKPLNEFDDTNSSIGLQQKIRHFIVFEKSDFEIGRRIQNQLDFSPLIFFSKTSSSQFNNQKNNIQDSPLVNNRNNLLRIYFRTYGNYYTLRLYNISEKQGAQFKLPSNFKIENELTLTANQSKQEWKKKQMNWTTEQNYTFQNKFSENIEEEKKTNIINLKTMQLRVFKVIQLE